jgi:rifampicin phosphotransferase
MSDTQPSPLLLPLDDPTATIELVGGKGASLASARAAGFPVPDGFHVTTDAYRAFMAENALDDEVDRILQERIPVSSETLFTALRGMIESAPMGDELKVQLGIAYASLGRPDAAVAVRSSATAEDLPGASFAGQQDTFLNVHGIEELTLAVRKCWASLWTERAIQYRDRLGIDHRSVSMGVVVQVMVPADVAGIMFTANPTTGERAEILVNASYGLGEAIVGGQVTPDSYTLRKPDLSLASVQIGEKSQKIVASADGTERQTVNTAQRAQRALSDEQLRELGALGVRLQEHFNDLPQDIEWAFAEGRLWLLQSRPVTGLPAQPLHDVRWESPIPGAKWIRRQIVEHMPGPLSPLFDELYLRQGLDRSTDRIMELLFSVSLETFMDRPLFTTVNGFAYMRADTHVSWRVVGAYVRAITREIPALFERAEPHWRGTALPEYTAEVRRWSAIDPASATDQQLLEAIRDIAWADASYWFAAALVIGEAKITDSLLDTFLVKLAPGTDLHSGQLLRGLPSKTLDAEEELEDLADVIRHSDVLRALVAQAPAETMLPTLEARPEARGLLRDLREYLEQYGHQIYSLDFVEPTQIDDPLPVLVTLKAMAMQPRVDTAARRDAIIQSRNARARQTARSLDPIRRRGFKKLLRWAWKFAPLREEALFYLGLGWPTLRRLALELGRRLAESGSLLAAHDVFFLEFAELEGALAARSRGSSRHDLAALASSRRELRTSRTLLHPPAAVPPDYRFSIGAIDLSSRETQRRNEPTASVLNGFAVSPGRVTAPASVIMSPADFGFMRPGSILVCPITTPAWTPLFAHAGGLVTDIGGVLAHGSIVAREYGIPAVMGTGQGTQFIKNGQTITVDGDAGTVRIGAMPDERDT